MSRDFPRVETLEKSADGEYIYGGSVGINRVLGFFRENAYKANKQDIRVLIVNIYTIFRNVYRKDATDAELSILVGTEISLISQYYEAYTHTMRSPVYQPILLVYIPDYDSAISQSVAHTKSAATVAMDSAYTKLVNSNFPKMVQEAHTQYTLTYFVKTDLGIYPHRSILGFVRKFSSAWKLSTTHCAFLVSHCPVDWYLLGSTAVKISLLESYTGNIRSQNELGERLTGSKHVPFNRYTHRLFGDKYHISSLVKPKDKRALIELAEKNHWVSRPNEAIVADICQHLHISVEIISSLKI
jgi:hypothetical protein